MKRKNYDDGLEYFQIMTTDGFVNIVYTPKEETEFKDTERVFEQKKDKRKLYTFKGKILRYDQCLSDNFKRSTLAVSEQQAINNIMFAAKKLCNLKPSVGGFKLVGDLTSEDR